MEKKNLKKKLQKVLSDQPSGALEKTKWMRENRSWLKKSQNIAMKVLDILEAKGWNKQDLAQRMSVSAQQVSKIVKGKENLTLATIAKLENALEVTLIQTLEGVSLPDRIEEWEATVHGHLRRVSQE